LNQQRKKVALKKRRNGLEGENMDYPPRNTDSAEKIWIGRECGFRVQRLIAADEVGAGSCCQYRGEKLLLLNFSGGISDDFLGDGNLIAE
jgi:hypothetical protein